MSSKSEQLTVQEKSSLVSKEGEFRTKLMESALVGDNAKLEASVDAYSRKNCISPFEILTQFKDGRKRTALHFACQSMARADEGDIVEKILCDKWFPNLSDRQSILKQKDKDGLTPIMLAAQHKDPIVAQRRVTYILSRAGDVKLGLARSRAGATALHYASGAGATPDTIKSIYEAGHVAATTFSTKGGTPLHWACAASKDFTRTIGALLECGADVNAEQCGDQGTIPPPLALACAAGNDLNGKRLLQCPEISIDARLPGNATLFHMAANVNMAGTLSMLLEKLEDKAILNEKNIDGFTPLDLAAREGHIECVLKLLPRKDGVPATTEHAKAFVEYYNKSARKAEDSIQLNKKASDRKEISLEDQAKRKVAEITACVAASEEDIQKSLALKKKGNLYFGKKKWEQAHNLYTRAIELNPKEATLYSNRSACCISLNRPKEALQDAYVARTLRPKWSKAYYRLAVARLALERYEDAAMAAWEGLQQDQNNNELKNLLQKCVKKGRQSYQQSKAGRSS